jgi:hypothetical protein
MDIHYIKQPFEGFAIEQCLKAGKAFFLETDFKVLLL